MGYTHIFLTTWVHGILGITKQIDYLRSGPKICLANTIPAIDIKEATTNITAGTMALPVFCIRAVATRGATPPHIVMLKLCPRESPVQRSLCRKRDVKVAGKAPVNNAIKMHSIN